MHRVEMFQVKVPTIFFGTQGFSAHRDGRYCSSSVEDFCWQLNPADWLLVAALTGHVAQTLEFIHVMLHCMDHRNWQAQTIEYYHCHPS
jgi:hypothetical protein